MKFKKDKSVQNLLEIKTFTKYGIQINKDEFVFLNVAPINVSVLSNQNVEIKIRHLMMILSSVPDIEISCSDASECFDENKAYLKQRIENEDNKMIIDMLKNDLKYLDEIQTGTSTSRKFMFVIRCKSLKEEQVLQNINRIQKIISDQGFEVSLMKKEDIKRQLAIYFGTSLNGEQIADVDGIDYIKKNQPK